MTTPVRADLALAKHEGAGNDFLVLVDVDGDAIVSDAQVRALCDRRRGVGADGFIRVGPGRDGADLLMELRNADAGAAEMSGNGIRCLAQAAVLAGLVSPPRFTVATAAGVRSVDYRPGPTPGRAHAVVEMGSLSLGDEEPAPAPGRRARRVDVGNPHLVVLGPDPATLDVAQLAEKLAAAEPEGVNVEFVAPGPDPGELTLRVVERGVGETLACGTGSCAAAAAARSWGLVGDHVRVANPGGVLEVTLGPGDRPEARLGGPVRKVADVVVPADFFG
ncbi:MAG TPA: diaminopimelate epimerase [Acidimicrobiales bacterium]|nr:diaminopimelate epimerase [Acidimicrobiales bacterium]